jgi:hypothetical protein
VFPEQAQPRHLTPHRAKMGALERSPAGLLVLRRARAALQVVHAGLLAASSCIYFVFKTLM